MATATCTLENSDDLKTVLDLAEEQTHRLDPLLFGRYQPQRELGRGGMGIVILAHDNILEIPVALKLIPETVLHDADGILGLKKEVLRGMELTHPNIVRVFSFEQDATTAAIVMECVQGETLAQIKARRPSRCFDCVEILPWVTQLCAALDYAHREARIAHRDLKPGNLMLTHAGRLKVADFGIASSISDTVSRVSVQNCASGTPPYMSPQQVMGNRPTHLDDIYSLGATIYELLSGRPPFFRGNILAQVMNEEPVSLAQRRAELEVHDGQAIPAAWEKAIAACLSKDAQARPASASDFLMMLTEPERALVVRAPINLQELALEVAPIPEPIQRVHPRPPPTQHPAHPHSHQVSDAEYVVESRRSFSLQPLVNVAGAVASGTVELFWAIVKPLFQIAVVIGLIWLFLHLKHLQDQSSAQREAEARQVASLRHAAEQMPAPLQQPTQRAQSVSTLQPGPEMPPPRGPLDPPMNPGGPGGRRPPPHHGR